MKKIVALVLSLVMALSLCTVAFAYTGTVVYGVDTNKNVDKTDVQNFTLTTIKAHTEKDGTNNVEYYVYDTGMDYAVHTSRDEVVYEATCDNWDDVVNTPSSWTVKDVLGYLVPCTQDDADFAMYKNGSFNTWLMDVDEDYAYYDAKGVAQKATTAKPNCTTTQFFEDGYVCADGCHFYIEASNWDAKLNVDGKIVFVKNVSDDYNYVVWASHIFAKGVKNDKTGYDVATCLICKGEFACTNDEAVATKNGYKISTGFEYDVDEARLVYDENAYDNGYDFAWGQTYATNYKFCWQLKAGTTEEIGVADTTTVDTNKGVESAKTFDAGIAMYVGMSLMSVAGTAVVIGKKKEF